MITSIVSVSILTPLDRYCVLMFSSIHLLKKNIDKLRNKKVAILCIGASPYDESAFAEIKAHNLTGDLTGIPLFYGRGAWNESKMKYGSDQGCSVEGNQKHYPIRDLMFWTIISFTAHLCCVWVFMPR